MLHQVALAHGATTRQVALRFLLRYPSLFVIPKAAQLAHVTDNAGATNFELSMADITAIDNAFERGPPRSELPMN